MALELRRKSNQALKPKWWYGRYDINGKRHCVNLGVEVRGNPPKSLRKSGDKAFEYSRVKAQVKLDGLISEARSQKNAEKHLEELYELKSGSSIEQIPLADIESCWLNLPSRKRRTELWEKNQCTTLRKFKELIQGRHPQVRYLSQITPRMAQEWLRHLDELGFAAATYNDKMHLLKGFFDRIGPDAGIGRNPFSGCPTKLKTTVHHQPGESGRRRNALVQANLLGYRKRCPLTDRLLPIRRKTSRVYGRGTTPTTSACSAGSPYRSPVIGSTTSPTPARRLPMGL